jgi:hypothetical protein
MKHRFQVNSFEVKALVILIAIANDELGAHFSTGGHWCCNHAWRGCVNASTEWRRETLGSAKRRGNRLRDDLNLRRAHCRSNLFDQCRPDRQRAVLRRLFFRSKPFKANTRKK